MIYDDGVATDDELRVEVCPRCDNEVMSNNAEHCKICGLRLYNYCLGETKTDPNGNHPDWLEHHKNDSDARFCEKCGEHTTYGTEGLLRTWEDVKSSHDLTLDYDPVNDTIPF